ncbi:hypothetical protein N9R79_04265 [Vibrio sp.]|nr:hypothetical protein [Vibrio sp.]
MNNNKNALSLYQEVVNDRVSEYHETYQESVHEYRTLEENQQAILRLKSQAVNDSDTSLINLNSASYLISLDGVNKDNDEHLHEVNRQVEKKKYFYEREKERLDILDAYMEKKKIQEMKRKRKLEEESINTILILLKNKSGK